MTNVTSPFYKEKVTITYFLIGIFLIVTFDISYDVLDGMGLHVLFRSAIVGVTILYTVFRMVRYVWSSFQFELEESKKTAGQYERKIKDFIGEFKKYIEDEFEKWQFSQSEKEIAYLLLKGLSSKDMAAKRFTSERTIRNQCATIYQKSGLQGKTDFCAYFLQEFLTE
ncbi:MAG: hypothetical protein COW00_19920 [Bdellovibrio sp. CG12_big_fil_rev_8_21_14_0_65_39_13]|nr:MAG: hypothetical protein COW78_02095 [Bdellovibrio sp. CG22_combo_CG10-13_8_21_14_all_39_27]PIQ57642.1 MAG: hypothetical protein COW00_19920 [Bdellovibrio sp. CG12_big_fil_rev_8_21_14_0_65_39_13]PIR35806.1 MAG: hypothetical protein COV37_06300 [Bdellovibrio sp. CG11_big_fil_rev_8_21_14_0_20_39_38]PJB53513.1 MAG: hypothetical protein CO099_06655 [Bdellovibrio sp. CG_4_9_14_3_um_filter_39_7]